MIISASRRTDIPALYSDWFFGRIEKGYVCVRNPMNTHQISKINLSPDIVDCIVLWTKNPRPMLEKLPLLSEYPFYFQFTLNPYDEDIEKNIPEKNELLETFKRLSEIIGPQKVIWRYDPVLLNHKYTTAYHIEKFNEFAAELKEYTEKVTFSFIDIYKKNKAFFKTNRVLGEAPMTGISAGEKNLIAENFSKIARENNLLIATCAEDIDLSMYNIEHARCIDDRLIARISGCNFSGKKDKSQRTECGCVASIDIGEYNSCLNGCSYCYANCNHHNAVNNFRKHNVSSPLLIGEIQANDVVNERKMMSKKSLQKELFESS